MNRRRHHNVVPVAALVRWIIVFVFIGVIGLSYVYFKNQMQSTGSDIRNLEAQIAQVDTQDDVVRAQISRLSSRAYLEKRLSEHFIDMTPITEDHIVRLNGASRTAAAQGPADAGEDNEDGIRTVANRLATQ